MADDKTLAADDPNLKAKQDNADSNDPAKPPEAVEQPGADVKTIPFKQKDIDYEVDAIAHTGKGI